jgi:hypothetical protein
MYRGDAPLLSSPAGVAKQRSELAVARNCKSMSQSLSSSSKPDTCRIITAQSLACLMPAVVFTATSGSISYGITLAISAMD